MSGEDFAKLREMLRTRDFTSYIAHALLSYYLCEKRKTIINFESELKLYTHRKQAKKSERKVTFSDGIKLPDFICIDERHGTVYAADAKWARPKKFDGRQWTTGYDGEQVRSFNTYKLLTPQMENTSMFVKRTFEKYGYDIKFERNRLLLNDRRFDIIDGCVAKLPHNYACDEQENMERKGVHVRFFPYDFAYFLSEDCPCPNGLFGGKEFFIEPVTSALESMLEMECPDYVDNIVEKMERKGFVEVEDEYLCRLIKEKRAKTNSMQTGEF